MRKAIQYGAKDTAAILNVSLYLLLFQWDLMCFVGEFFNAVGDLRRRFVAKHLATMIYETADDVRDLLGKEFRLAMARLEVPVEIRTRFDATSSALNGFWDEQRESLKQIRNVVAAHRHQDALEYLRVFDGIDSFGILNRATSLALHLDRLLAALTGVVRECTKPGAFQRDVERSQQVAATPQHHQRRRRRR